MGGKGAAKRSRTRKAKLKQAAKKTSRQSEKFIASLPKITERDLLNFQLAHFGDETCPDNWFITHEEAENLQVQYDAPDDGLGYYADGVKRTLTDEQILMFRRSELWQIHREEQLKKEDIADAPSPESVASSLEYDLIGLAPLHTPRASSQKPTKRSVSIERSDTVINDPNSAQRHRPHQNIPYSQRHKRKWERYVEQVDAVEGAITHRRLARELDDQHTEQIDMEY